MGAWIADVLLLVLTSGGYLAYSVSADRDRSRYGRWFRRRHHAVYLERLLFFAWRLIRFCS